METGFTEEGAPIQHCSTLKSAVDAVDACKARIADAEATLQALMLKQATLVQAQRLLEQRALAEVLHEPLGFQNSRPTAALLVHRCLVHWSSFSSDDAASKALLEGLIRSVSQEVDEDEVTARLEGTARLNSTGNGLSGSPGPLSPGSAHAALPLSSGASTSLAHYAYWLTVLSTLLALVHRSVPPHPSHTARLHASKSSAKVSGSGLPPGSGPPPHAVAAAAAAKFNGLKHSLASFGKNLIKRAAAPAPSQSATQPQNLPQGQPQLGRPSSSGPQEVSPLHGVSSGELQLPAVLAGPKSDTPGVTSPTSSGSQVLHGTDGLPTVAQVFRKDLDMALQQCFVACRDSLKKQLSQVLPSCVHAPVQATFSPPSSPPVTALRATPKAAPKAGSHTLVTPSTVPTQPVAGVGAEVGPQSPLQAALAASGQPASAFEKLAEEIRLDAADSGARFTLDDEEEEEEQEQVPAPTKSSAAVSQASAHGTASSRASTPTRPATPATAAAAAGLDLQRKSDASKSESVGEEQSEEQAALEAARAAAMQPWAELIGVLQEGLQVLREGSVPRILIKCVFKQVLSFINVQLFNQLLLRPECCSASNARHVLRGLKMLDAWIMQGADDTLMRPLYLELRHVRQAATFLVTPKGQLTPEDISTQLCPALNSQQVYRLATTFWDDMGSVHATSTGGNPQPGGDTGCASSSMTEGASCGPGMAGGEAGADGAPAAATPRAVAAQAGQAVAPMALDMVSGEVLEALKASSRDGGGGVVGNGGLIVTCLLDDETQPIISPQGCTAFEVLQLVESKELYGPMMMPPQLNTPDCPGSVFAFVESALPVPPALLQSAKS